MHFLDENSLPACFTLGSDVNHASISQDCKHMITAFADKLILTDCQSQKVKTTFAIDGNINDIHLSEEGAIYAVTNRDSLWISHDSNTREIKLPEEATAVTVFEGTAYVGTKRGNLMAVCLESGKTISSVQISGSKITRLAVATEKKIVGVGSSNGNLSFYSITESKLLCNDLKYHNMPITAICFAHNDATCITAAVERAMHVWDVNKLQHTAVINSKLI